MTSTRLIVLFVLLSLCLALPAGAARPVRAASFPALSADGRTVFFSCWGDIWSAPRDGSGPAMRLTDNVAYDARPIPSPDGSKLLFASDRFGNLDMFTMPVEGGDATRLTWGSGVDYPYDWRPDGLAVLEYAMGQDIWGNCLYEVPLDGSQPVRITGPDQADEVFSSYLDSAGRVVFARGAGDWSRKRYKGSATYELWSFDRNSNRYIQLTENHYNDMWPQPSPDGKLVYFVSDRDGTQNLWRMDLARRESIQLTHFTGDGVRWPRISPDGDEIAFEVFGEIYAMKLDGGKPEKVQLSFADDPKHEMAATYDQGNNVSEYALSPNGKYFAVVVMGDLFLLKNPDSYPPDAKPDQDLSRTIPICTSPGREMQPAWSPDNMKLAYVSDREGQFDVYVYDLVKKEERRITTGTADEWYPNFSPAALSGAPAEQLIYYSGNRKLALFDLVSGKEEILREGQLRNGPWALGYEWSPDGKWVAYVEDTKDTSGEVFIINLEKREPVDISFTPDWDSGPTWSKDGKWLSFTHSGETGSDVMLLELNPEKDTYDTEILFPEDKPKVEPKPELEKPKAEPEKPADAKDKATPAVPDNKPEAKPAEPAKPEEKKEEKKEEAKKEGPKLPEPITIDMERIHLRSKAISTMPGSNETGVFDPQSKYLLFSATGAGKPEFWAYTLKEKKLAKLGDIEGQSSPQFAPDDGRLYFLAGGGIGFIALAGTNVTGRGGVNVTSHLSVDTYRNWEQMLNEGWRHLRDGFYDRKMLGVDWNDVLKRYAPRVREIATHEEYNQVMREMLGELGASHLGFFDRQNSREAPADATADFGVFFDEAYAGPGWRVIKVFMNGPADKPGSKLYVNDVILKLNGQEIGPASNRGKLLLNLAGVPAVLTVKHDAPQPVVAEGDAPATAPTGPPSGERTVTIMPVPEGALGQVRYEQWVEDNRAAVYARSGKRVGYQHIQSMNTASLEKFRRELFSETRGREALIIDVRFNGGGRIHEDLINILDRRPFAYSGARDDARRLEPLMRWEGPIVVLINPNSYSDAEIFPHLMKELGLGTIMGEPTGGNVIGTYDFTLLDGSSFRLPARGWWLLDGQDMEGNGAQPDVLVRFDPGQARMGKDNQLEAAVDYLQQKIEKK